MCVCNNCSYMWRFKLLCVKKLTWDSSQTNCESCLIASGLCSREDCGVWCVNPSPQQTPNVKRQFL